MGFKWSCMLLLKLPVFALLSATFVVVPSKIELGVSTPDRITYVKPFLIQFITLCYIALIEEHIRTSD